MENRHNKVHQEAATILVARARRGDAVAFGQLVSRYRRRIYALALQMTGNESDADDVAQEVFIRAYRALPRFEGRSHFFTWVYRMGVNLSLNAKRSRKRRAERPLDDPRVERALRADAGGDPVKAAELRDTYARLLAVLDTLPGAMKTSVVLVTLQGLSHQEAAVVQQCAAGTVAWRIHEARSRLRTALAVKNIARPTTLSTELGRLLREFCPPAFAPTT